MFGRGFRHNHSVSFILRALIQRLFLGRGLRPSPMMALRGPFYAVSLGGRDYNRPCYLYRRAFGSICIKLVYWSFFFSTGAPNARWSMKLAR